MRFVFMSFYSKTIPKDGKKSRRNHSHKAETKMAEIPKFPNYPPVDAPLERSQQRANSVINAGAILGPWSHFMTFI
jgi:hypothetical protein